jgi:S1-C subfamily serine protease
VVGVQSGSGAEAAGLQQGDTIVGIDNTTINSATDLTHVIVTYAPKDTVRVSWVDSSGSSHHASVVLGSGPPA